MGVPRTNGVEVIKNEMKQMNVTYKEPRIKQAGTRTRKVRLKGGAAKGQDVLCSGAMQPSSCSSFLSQWWDQKMDLAASGQEIQFTSGSVPTGRDVGPGCTTRKMRGHE